MQQPATAMHVCMATCSAVVHDTQQLVKTMLAVILLWHPTRNSPKTIQKAGASAEGNEGATCHAWWFDPHT